MARSLNKVMLIGNVGADPEIRAVGSGSRVAQFNLATGYRKKDGNEVTHWHRIVVWERPNAGGGDPFNVIERFVKKGTKLYVEGEIEYRSYEDKDGVTKYVTEIRPREVLMLDGPGGGGGDFERSSGGFDRGSRSGSGSSAPARPAAGGGAGGAGGYDDFQAGGLDDDDDLPF
jgi:single-strand DNA-binding protein